MKKDKNQGLDLKDFVVDENNTSSPCGRPVDAPICRPTTSNPRVAWTVDPTPLSWSPQQEGGPERQR